MEHSCLISADSHVAVSLDVIRERVPARLRSAFDDAIAQQAHDDKARRQGRKLSLEDWDMEASGTRAIATRWLASRLWTAIA